MPGRS